MWVKDVHITQFLVQCCILGMLIILCCLKKDFLIADKMLCDKVNVELEGFGNSLQGLLSQQFDHVSHLVSIAKNQNSQPSQVSIAKPFHVRLLESKSVQASPVYIC